MGALLHLGRTLQVSQEGCTDPWWTQCLLLESTHIWSIVSSPLDPLVLDATCSLGHPQSY